MARYEIGANFVVPRQEFLAAVQLVQPDCVLPGDLKPGSDKTTTGTPPPPTPVPPAPPAGAPAPRAPDAPDDPFKTLSQEVLNQVKQTTVLQLLEELLAKKANPLPAGDKSVEQKNESAGSPTDQFVLNEHLLTRLMAINAFPRNPTDKLIFFGLRGCLPAGWSDGSTQDFAESQTLKLVDINYQNPRCTIGQWDTESHTIAVFPGSTVPTLKCERFSDKPPWPAFRDRAYNEQQNQFSYILLDGATVAQVANNPDAKAPLLLRCGSHQSALPEGQGDLIAKIQTALKEQGFYNGAPDGNFGAVSAQAAAEFQRKDIGAMFVDAVVGPQTAKALLPDLTWPAV